MMVDDHLHSREGTEERPKRRELVICPRIEDKDNFGLAVILTWRRKLLDAGLGIEKAIARRKRAGDDHLDFLALPPEHLFQSQHRAQPITVRTDMGREQEALMAVDDLDKLGPIERHARPFPLGFGNFHCRAVRGRGKARKKEHGKRTSTM